MSIPQTTALRSTLQSFLAAPPTFALTRVPTEATQTRQAAARIESVFGDGSSTRPPNHDLDRLHRKVVEKWKARAFDSLSLLEVRRSR